MPQSTRMSATTPSPLQRLRHDQRGLTLPEVLIGMLLMLVVAGSVVVCLQSAVASSGAIDRRGNGINEGQFALSQITRDIRVANAATVQSSTVLDLLTWRRPSPGAPQVLAHVRYDCSTAATCRRIVCAPSATTIVAGACAGAGTTIVTGITNTDVFTPLGDGAVLATPASTPACCSTTGGLDFVALRLRPRVDERSTGAQTRQHSKNPIEYRDGADLANFSN